VCRTVKVGAAVMCACGGGLRVEGSSRRAGMLGDWEFCTWIGSSLNSEIGRIGFMSGSSSELRFLYTPAFRGWPPTFE
jgi:hypothetical protein